MQKYLDHQAFLKKEQEQKDELFYRLIEIHGLEKTSQIPPLFYMKVEEVRNDSGMLGKVNKHYKQGVPYSAISYAYDYCKEKINYAQQNIKFDSKLGEMNYCLAIVRNNLVDAYYHAVNKKRQERTQQETTEKDMSIAEVGYQQTIKKKDEMDISNLL